MGGKEGLLVEGVGPAQMVLAPRLLRLFLLLRGRHRRLPARISYFVGTLWEMRSQIAALGRPLAVAGTWKERNAREGR